MNHLYLKKKHIFTRTPFSTVNRGLTCSNGSRISVIVGKTFEATTLPDGSQQIIEDTKYKRLSDGYIYIESKMRSLGGDWSVEPSVDLGNKDGSMEDEERDDAMQMRNIDEGNAMWDVMHHHSSHTKDFAKNEHEHLDGDILSTLSSLSFSSVDDENHTHMMPVITEDHVYHQAPNNKFVEEYLYDNDPVGLQQWKDQEQHQPLSPTASQNNNSTNSGWYYI